MRFGALRQRFLRGSISRIASRNRARPTAEARITRRRSLLESLEARMVLTTFYVDANLTLTADRDSSGGITAGDQVTFGQGQAYKQANLTYDAAPVGDDTGTAFISIGQAVDSPLVKAGDTIDIAAGNYSEPAGIVIDRDLTLQGLGNVVISYPQWQPVQPPQPVGEIQPMLYYPNTMSVGDVGITITGDPDNVTLANLNIYGFNSSLYCDGCGTLNLSDLALNDSHLLVLGQPFTGPLNSSISGPPNSSISNVADLNLTSSANSAQTVTVASEKWYVSSYEYVSFFEGNERFGIEAVNHLSINTAGGADTYYISPLPSTTIDINGGDPAPPASPGDALNLNLADTTGADLAVATDTSGSSGSWTFSNRQPVLFKNIETLSPNSSTILGITLNATEGVDTGSQVVARFVDPNGAGPLSDYMASVNWGDGNTSIGVVSFDAASGLFSVSGNHAYVEDGNYKIVVTLRHSSRADVMAASNAVIAETPILGTGLTLLGSAGVRLATASGGQWIEIATFTHGNGHEVFKNPGVATINWGDGTSSAGTVGQYASEGAIDRQYFVTGDHTYAKFGKYAIAVTVYDDGHPTVITSTATIGDSFLLPGTQGTPNQRFVAAVFNNLLARKIDPDGLGYWSAKLDAGASRQEVVAGIQNSDEYRHDEIDSLFQTYLHRDADPGAMAAEDKLLLQGATLQQLASIIVGSDEFFQQSGGTNDGFLAALFEDALQRGIDDSSKAALEQALTHGATRAQIADHLFASQEYRRDEVQSLYQEALRRDADPDGQAYWANQLAHGVRDERLLAALLSSQEYFDIVTGS